MNKENTIGVALTKCYFCGADSDIILNQRLTVSEARKVEAMHGKVVSMDPCPKCAEYMKRGIVLIGIDPDKSEPGWNKGGRIPNPHRTGHYIVITEKGFKHAFTEGPAAAFGLKHRWMFITEESIRALGLDRIVDPTKVGEEQE